MQIEIAPQKIYKAVVGSHLSDSDATIVGPELERLATLKGHDIPQLSAEDIVDAARDISSVLHGYFEWETEAAAYQYNLSQARYLARSFRVDIVTLEQQEPTHFVMPGLVSVKTVEAEHAYVPIESVLSNPELVAQVEKEAEQRLRYWANRYSQYRHFAEFAALEPIFSALDAILSN